MNILPLNLVNIELLIKKKIMIKILQSKEKQEIKSIVDTLGPVENAEEEVADDGEEVVENEEEPVVDAPVEVAGPEEKFIVDSEQQQENENVDEQPENENADEEVEVITITINAEDGENVEDGNDGEIEQEVVENQEDAQDDVVEGENNDEQPENENNDEQPEINLDFGKNVVDAALDVDAEAEGEAENAEAENAEDNAEDNAGSVTYEVAENELEGNGEEVTYYYEVKEGDYNASDDTYNAVIGEVSTEDKPKKEGHSVIGASVAALGAFGLIAGFGYKYSQRKKRVLLPFHEDVLEKGEFYDKNSTEQQIIPVWAAAKKEETEEEKEEEEKLFEVVYNYEPELPDELKLTVGDKIKIKEIYEDGWAYGYNKTTQLFGTFPSTSLGENFNPESVPQYKPEEVAVEINDNMVEELKKKIVESN
jgi:AAA ATPase containing von Willebrand factor type A (vWA) domain